MDRSCALVLPLIATSAIGAQLPIPYPGTPSHETDKPGVSTGGAFVDLNRDGWPDLVIANGNDILRQHVVAYYNKRGVFGSKPDWQSADIDYHGHLDCGDVNGDGWPDLVVSVYLGARRWGDPGVAKLYLNDGKGTLGTKPSWIAGERFFSFSLALGDVDLDGDLDLAVATGESYRSMPDYDRVFLNKGGTFSATADWKTSAKTYSYDTAFCDVDADGDLDLAFAGEKGPNAIYLNKAGTLPSTPSWTSTDGGARHSANTCCFADVDGDGRPDLCVSDNKQLGGSGSFRVYRNAATGFTKTPWWQSLRFHNGYTSAIAALDYDRDGDIDIVGGGWWAQTSWFRNVKGKLPTTPTWETTGTSVVEAVFFADVNRDGLRPAFAESKRIGAGRKLFRLAHRPVHRLLAVKADGASLAPGKYALDLDTGWLSVKTAPATSLSVDYLWSEALDMGVSNWDQTKGNYVFRRAAPVVLKLTPPMAATFGLGDDDSWVESLRVTTQSAQFVRYRSFVDLPSGRTLPLVQVSGLLPGAWSGSFRIRLPSPGGWAFAETGSHRYHVELLAPDLVTRMSAAGFVFAR